MRRWDILWITGSFEAVVDTYDLGIIMQYISKFSRQCAKVVSTANRFTGFLHINQGILYCLCIRV